MFLLTRRGRREELVHHVIEGRVWSCWLLRLLPCTWRGCCGLLPCSAGGGGQIEKAAWRRVSVEPWRVRVGGVRVGSLALLICRAVLLEERSPRGGLLRLGNSKMTG